jgi:hypothetical protein
MVGGHVPNHNGECINCGLYLRCSKYNECTKHRPYMSHICDYEINALKECNIRRGK